MAVTDVSGTAGLRARLKNLPGREPGSIRRGWWVGAEGHACSDYKRPLLQGERLSVTFLIKSGLMRLAEASYPSYCTHRWIFLSSMNVNHSSQQGLDVKKARTAQPSSFQTTVGICSSISRQVSQILYQEPTLSWWRSLTPPLTLETGGPKPHPWSTACFH